MLKITNNANGRSQETDLKVTAYKRAILFAAREIVAISDEAFKGIDIYFDGDNFVPGPMKAYGSKLKSKEVNMYAADGSVIFSYSNM